MSPSGIDRTAEAGLFGKLPARGDFVQIGLPGSFVRPWDAWLAQAIAASQERMGNGWLAAYLESPVWRFALPAGICGAGAVLGLLMPSVDRVGRYYPLTLAAVFPPGAGVPAPDAADTWLDACEAAGRAALEDDVPPDEVLRRLPPLGGAEATAMPQVGDWWTAGGPRVAATRLTLATLPDSERFESMLGSDLAAVSMDDALTPDAPAPDAFGPDAFGPDALGSDALGSDAFGPGVLHQDAPVPQPSAAHAPAAEPAAIIDVLGIGGRDADPLAEAAPARTAHAQGEAEGEA